MQVVPNPRQDAPKVGRPRDEVVETKIIESALTLYGEVGWAASNLTKVASAAGGKSSIYTRWKPAMTSMKDAFARLVRCPGPRGIARGSFDERDESAFANFWPESSGSSSSVRRGR